MVEICFKHCPCLYRVSVNMYVNILRKKYFQSLLRFQKTEEEFRSVFVEKYWSTKGSTAKLPPSVSSKPKSELVVRLSLKWI